MAGILLKGGRIIDPASETDETGDVLIRDGLIEQVGSGCDASPDDETFDCEGLIIAPGLIDPHVHFRQPGQEHKETIHTGSACAVKGGFTSVVCMPNTNPALDAPQTLTDTLAAAESQSHCRVFLSAAATVGRKGEQLTDFDALSQAGAVAFTDDGDVIESDTMMTAALKAAARVGAPLMQHCQDPSMTVGACMHLGRVSTRLGLTGWPRQAEEQIVDRDIRLNESIGAKYHVQHISSGGTVEILRRARAMDGNASRITGEASPHHLTLTVDACAALDTNAKMNPPLREDSDVLALRQGVADGVVTVLGTDHAPHSLDEKRHDFASAPFGILGLETALPLYAEALVSSGAIDWPRLIALLTINPARLCGLDAHGLGSLHSGGPADVTVIDPALQWQYDVGRSASKSRNSPFDGRDLTGASVLTIAGGAVRSSMIGSDRTRGS